MAPLPTSESLTFDFEPWLEPSGPVTTVWLPTPSATDEARERLRLEWKNVRDQVAESAPAETLAALDAATADPALHAEGHSVVLYGRGDDVALVPMADEVDGARAHVGALPRLTPLLVARQAAVPHLVVVTDRVGADILVVGPTGATDEASVDGDTGNIARSAPGGWSQRRFQQRAENTWEHNAAEVADTVERLRSEVGARLVVVVGDERAVQFLTEHASAELADVLEVVHGAGRNDADPFEAVAHDVEKLLATVAAADTVELLDRFGAARNAGGPGAAADGPVQTMEMLSQGRVEVLLVAVDDADDRTACVDLATGQLAPDGAPLTELGLHPVEVPLVDATIWAALRTGAEVHLVPAHGPNAPRAGLAALLRG
ncbi:Vms1/Ankzf1 family peptidyl-tRNA hydrolase [Rhabdothermincola salaria]|uniref:baeRF2 domain-containing protein n=1 Tax=Rhabdothermincola salaria TaxID=2903142 RepID=UPI001E631407|nr:Vms1/Ankzf1 family peptidyl-tRNA hydrolase [Rhabdothermincola salaria]MCD9622809.1 hypothetical protein [Rhabdothermincola salaria]